MAMLDAACRASGLPLVKALIKAADNITMGHEAREDAPEFKVEQSKSQIVSSPDGVPLPDMSETHVSLRLDKAQKEEE